MAMSGGSYLSLDQGADRPWAAPGWWVVVVGSGLGDGEGRAPS